jgi:hypothetical protein
MFFQLFDFGATQVIGGMRRISMVEDGLSKKEKPEKLEIGCI